MQQGDYDLTRRSFLGIGFDFHSPPVDIVPLHLLGRMLPDFSLLVVDEFTKFGVANTYRTINLERALEKLDRIYGQTPRFNCSDFMGQPVFGAILEKIRDAVLKNEELKNLAFRTIIIGPYAYDDKDLEYTINEIACVVYLYSTGFRLKIGPERERKYDKLIRCMNENGRYGFRNFVQGLEFGYTIPPVAITGKQSIPYVPYVVGNNEIRIFLEDPEDVIIKKLKSAQHEALLYLAVLGCAASNVIDGNYDIRQIQRLGGHGLLDAVTRVLLDSIIRPYREASVGYE